MDVAAYTQARYGRLIEYAVELGVPDGEAATYVDHVLLEQRRRIKRAADPDPIVREALAMAIQGRRVPGRDTLAIVVVLGAVFAAVALVAIFYAPPAKPVPSLFGLDSEQATEVLVDQGWDVVVRPVRACDPQDLVLASDPPVGAIVGEGSTVTVRSAIPYENDCLGRYQQRADAWEFVRWARGVGPPPEFADRVGVILDDGEPTTFTDGAAARRERWGATLGLIDDFSRGPAETDSGMPTLTVVEAVPPAAYCRLTRPVEVGERESLRLAVDPSSGGTTLCPLTIDLYRVDGVIDSVVIYTPTG